MKKINLFDSLVAILLVGLVILFGSIALFPKRDLGTPAFVTVKVQQGAEEIYPEAQKMGTVYLNGQKAESKIVEVEKQPGAVLITIEGFGKKEGEVYLFNGQRILINQKAELHGGFWAQGNITEFKLK